ncbi:MULTISPECIES: DUF2316 family protein [Aerococcus]|uniref:DUF2316 family protein n=2 Tax=Bacillati TaxID=1783272 RepID=UPI0018A786AE|nr:MULTISPECIES: DUF2316 family protein [Aerococcus]MCY3035462.1 DUF2316 family protein [Aerococcus sp. Group 2]MCY3038884.1 DUF2316 family protein [Aerococcus sp. Group 2]MCY3041039.1 DUF2316 family protein [Aerococcus sp. Group 2]MCY3042277.1 DUF2316 family protein [Aerococcus sp. Group 2]MDK6520402.1 DUF2316 family protein [Aerococcus urinae]
MSLTQSQREETKQVLKTAFNKTGLSKQDLADILETSESYLDQVFQLQGQRLEDAWILKNYLNTYLSEHEQESVTFQALAGDYHDYWFLDAKLIERGLLK